MSQDLTLPSGSDGMVNIRVGAIIRRGDKLLMMKDKRDGAYYTIGGRVQFGETAEEAIRREVEEELGFQLQPTSLAFIHENFFYGDYEKLGYNKLVYEICWYFLMETPENLEALLSSSRGEESENLSWISLDTSSLYYPQFFREELKKSFSGVKHLVSADARA
ncbi:MAG: NUDIX domain-containing protein [Spirochaetales bacterium]|nr:NUDIX domain-containing protein [Candidatus Physcosoma equi]